LSNFDARNQVALKRHSTFSSLLHWSHAIGW